MIKIVLLAIACLLTLSVAAPRQDLVTNIDVPYSGHDWYSGYLNFTHGAFHYVFFESQRDPDNDPIMLWMNGGPGCSSMIGMVYENGPFVYKPNTTELQANQYSWNKKANLLYITTPQGVGFSVGTPERLDDQTVATYNLKALLQFFVKFPNLKKNDFYISGESYAGIYIPYLVIEILKHNKLPSSKQSIIKLKGIMIGNGCTIPEECYDPGLQNMSIFQYQYLFKRAFISEKDYTKMRAVCILGYFSQQCAAIRKVLDKKFQATKTSTLNIYTPCFYQISNKIKKIKQNGRRRLMDPDEGDCDDSLGIQYFFNQPFIFEKLHVNAMHFEQCSQSVSEDYVMSSNASFWIYPIMLKQKLRIWAYSGDNDADVPIPGTLTWIERLRQQQGLVIVNPWRQWWVPGFHKHQDQVGGMTWQLKGFTFATVRGAGHQVPKDKRKEAAVLLDSFLNGVPLPQKSQ